MYNRDCWHKFILLLKKNLYLKIKSKKQITATINFFLNLGNFKTKLHVIIF